MKKSTIALMLLLAISLTACGKKEEQNNTPEQQISLELPTTETTATYDSLDSIPEAVDTTIEAVDTKPESTADITINNNTYPFQYSRTIIVDLTSSQDSDRYYANLENYINKIENKGITIVDINSNDYIATIEIINSLDKLQQDYEFVIDTLKDYNTNPGENFKINPDELLSAYDIFSCYFLADVSKATDSPFGYFYNSETQETKLKLTDDISCYCKSARDGSNITIGYINWIENTGDQYIITDELYNKLIEELNKYQITISQPSIKDVADYYLPYKQSHIAELQSRIDESKQLVELGEHYNLGDFNTLFVGTVWTSEDEVQGLFFDKDGNPELPDGISVYKSSDNIVTFVFNKEKLGITDMSKIKVLTYITENKCYSPIDTVDNGEEFTVEVNCDGSQEIALAELKI